MDFAVPLDYRVKIMLKDRKIPGSCHRVEKFVEHEGDSDTNCIWCSWNSPQRLGKETGGTGDQRKNWDHPDCSTVKILKRLLKTEGDLL